MHLHDHVVLGLEVLLELVPFLLQVVIWLLSIHTFTTVLGAVPSIPVLVGSFVLFTIRMDVCEDIFELDKSHVIVA